MLCGSCIRDNALARALASRGHDVRLVPLYQRSRSDESSISEKRVRFGGISVFLQHAAPLFGAVPGLDRVLDSAALLGFVERFSSTTDPTRLGPLTVTTLEGERGSARRAVEALAESVRPEPGDARPDVVVLPNSLLLGLAAPLAAATGAPVVVTFSGEDLFLSQLPLRGPRAGPPPHAGCGRRCGSFRGGHRTSRAGDGERPGNPRGSSVLRSTGCGSRGISEGSQDSAGSRHGGGAPAGDHRLSSPVSLRRKGWIAWPARCSIWPRSPRHRLSGCGRPAG